MYINKTLTYISSFLILSTLLIPNFFINAQEEVFQNPEIKITKIEIKKDVYKPNEEVKGTFTLKNTRDYDTGNIYYSVVLVGSDDENAPKYEKLYDLSDPIGPFFVPASGELTVEFSFKMFSYKPEEYLGLRFDAFLETGFRLSKSEVHLKTEGEVLPQLTVSEPVVTVGGKTISITQKPIIYKNEKASFKYILENLSESPVKIEPQIMIREVGDLNNILAKYNDPQLQIGVNNSATVINSIKTFENTPGIYLARIDFIDENGNKRATPLIFTYIVDGDIAVIESILSDSGYELLRGEEFNITILYQGKPYDVRDSQGSQIVKGASVFIEVLNLHGKTIAEETIQMDLDARGKIDIPMTAGISAKGFKVNVRISKDGELLAESSLNIPNQNKGIELPMYVYIILSIIAIVIIIYAVFLKLKSKGIFFLLFLLLTLLGGANSADALTTVYTVGDSAYIPTNITGFFNEGDHTVGGNVYASIEFDIVENGTPNENRAFSEWGGNCQQWGGCAGYEMVFWTDPTDVSHLSAGPCLTGDNCDEDNLSYWRQGDYGEESVSCDTNGCRYEESFTFTSDVEGTFRAYFYIRNEQLISDENGEYYEVVGAALVYEDFYFYDPWAYIGEGTYCFWDYADESDYFYESESYPQGEDIPVGEEIKWTLRSDEYMSSGDDYFLDPWTFMYGDSEMLLFWEGDIGDSPRLSGSSLDSPGNWKPRNLWYWFDLPDYFCQNQGYQWADVENGGCIEETQEEYCEYDEYGNPIYCGYSPSEEFIPVTGANWMWGLQFITTYSTSTLPTDGTIDVSLRYRKDPGGGHPDYYSSYKAVTTGEPDSTPWEDTSSDSYGTLDCIIARAGSDLCGNLEGVQSKVPAGYGVYPDISDVGTNGISYSDLNCFPISLARQSGTVTLSGTPNPANVEEGVEWTFSLSPDYFTGILDGITFNIPRFATITWSGDISDSAYISGNSATLKYTNTRIPDVSLTGIDKDISVAYSEEGSAGVTVTIEDQFISLTANDIVTINGEVCLQECDVCPTEEPCDNGVVGDESVISSFAISNVIVNTGDQCTLSWATNDLTYGCVLNTPSGDIDVATSSTGYLVDPGQYSLTCVNYAPEITVEGPLSCILNPNLKEN